MKRKLKHRSKLKWIIPAMAMLMVSPAMYGAPPPGNASQKASDKMARHAELTSKYAMTQQQLQQYDKLLAERNAAQKSVNQDGTLSNSEHNKRIKAIGENFETKMASVMDKQQYDKWLKNRKANMQQYAKNNKELREKISQIRNSDAPYLQQNEQISAAKAQFVEKAASISENQKDAEHKLQSRNARNAMAGQSKKNVKLSLEQAKQLQTLTNDKKRKIDELKTQSLPKDRHKVESEKIITSYEADVKKLLGEQKYAQWNKNLNTSQDNYLKWRFNMTPEQITKYKELQNARAIENYKVSHSKIPKAERPAKVKEIDAKYDAKIKEILTADQSRKLFADKAYSEQKKAASKTKNK